MKDKKIFIVTFFGVVIALTLGFVLFNSSIVNQISAHGTSSNGKWGDWKDSSTCVATTCGTTQGKKTQTKTCEHQFGKNECNPGETVCVKDCPSVTWSTSQGHCPTDESAYTSTDHKECSKKIDGHWRYADKIVDQSFGPITVTYEKSEDPNHCHRPTAESLGVPEWARSNFNCDLPELKNKVDVCHQEGAQTETQQIDCNDAPVISCDQEGQCPTTCGQPASRVPDGQGGFKTCPATDPCVTVTPELTPTPGTGTGLPGDGRSDGRSDGLSSCPSCTQAPQGQVLGASTGPQVLGLSNTAGENELMQLAQALGAFAFSMIGLTLFKKNA